ncbi:MAG: ATP-binding cassette domain-containing protein [Bacilli bacterium]|nr:ATP-binding cassette domain-containing protein [Bacilli bacterium]
MIALKGVRLGFDSPSGEKRAVLDIGERVFPSKGFIGIKGPSGIGKTTLLNVLSLMEGIDEGQILYNGEDLAALPRAKKNLFVARHIGYLRQNVALLPHLNVLDNVLLPTSFLSFGTKKEEKDKAMALLKRFGVQARSADLPPTLSGGELSRVGLCRALINGPDILLCDEPTDALDEAEAHRLLGYLKEISEQILVVIVSHDEALLSAYVDSLLSFEGGDLHGEAPLIESMSVERKGRFRPLEVASLGAKRFLHTKAKKAASILISCFGFVGVALGLGFHNGALALRQDTEDMLLSGFPTAISSLYIDAGSDSFESLDQDALLTSAQEIEVKGRGSSIHYNVITDSFLDYLLANLEPTQYLLDEAGTPGFLRKDAGGYSTFSGGANLSSDLLGGYLSSLYGDAPALKGIHEDFASLPSKFDCIAGDYPTSPEDLFVVVRQDNKVSDAAVEILGLGEGKHGFDEVVGREFKFVPNASLYKKLSSSKQVTARFLKGKEELKAQNLPASSAIPYAVEAANCYNKGDVEGTEGFIDRIDALFGEEETRTLYPYGKIASEEKLGEIYEDGSIGKTLRVKGILRQSESTYLSPLEEGVYYGRELSEFMASANRDSPIAQEIYSHLTFARSGYTLSVPTAYSIWTEVTASNSGDAVETAEALYEHFLLRSGFVSDGAPNNVIFRAKTLAEAKSLESTIDAYNAGKPDYEKMLYSKVGLGYIDTFEGYLSTIDAASWAIFVVVLASHMVVTILFCFLDAKGRKGEIGLYRSLGASGFKISGVFLSEGLLTGLLTGAIGVGLAYGSLRLFNAMIRGGVGNIVISEFARLSFLEMSLLILLFVAISLFATFLGTLAYGLLKPAHALRAES